VGSINAAGIGLYDKSEQNLMIDNLEQLWFKLTDD
jgi:hypothetical protein